MCYYIQKIIFDENNKFLLAQVIECEEGTPIVKTKFVDANGLMEIYNSGSKVDFTVENGKIRSEADVVTVESDDMKDCIGQESIVKPEAISIYDLFDDIVELNGLYISRTEREVEDAEELSTDDYDMFIPEISNCTMSIYLCNKKHMRKIVSKDKGNEISTTDFLFAVPKINKEELISKYDLKYIKDMSILNMEFSLFRYISNLPVQRYLNNFRVFKPYINKLCYLDRVNTDKVRLIDMVIGMLCKRKLNYTSYLTIDEECEGVVAELMERKYSPEDYRQFLTEARADLKTGKSAKELIQECGKPNLERTIYCYAVEILDMSRSMSKENLIELLLNRLLEYRKRKYIYRNILFSMRYGIMFNYPISKGQEVICLGSEVPYISSIKIV